jgi:photosystem II stability/assembly factor-like uncharacterized protein
MKKIKTILIFILVLGIVIFPTSALAGWTEQTASGGRQWVSVASSSDGTKLAAVAEWASIYTSTDSGLTWTEQTDSGSGIWSSIASSSDGTTLAASVNGGYIYTSTNSGASWTEQTGSGSRSWQNVTMSSDGTKIIATQNGSPYYSTNSGVTWAEGAWGASAPYATAMSSDGSVSYGVVSDSSDYIKKSTDYGANWTPLVNSVIANYRGIAAVVYGGYIYTSTDSGATWTEQTGSGSKNWRSIASSSDGTKLVAVVQNGYIYISTDSGVTWTEQTGAGSTTWYDVVSSSDGTKLAAVDYAYGYVKTYAPNNTPTDITLSTITLEEGDSGAGNQVATITTTDSDVGDSHTYTLVSGTGDEDNASFQIDGSTLEFAGTLDYETPTDLGDTAGNNTYAIRLETDDGNGGTYEEAFTITITNTNENPTITSNGGLSTASISYAEQNTTAVTTVTTTDEDSDTVTYTISGTDSDDFTINSTTGELTFTNEPNYEHATDSNGDNIYTITVTATDDGTGTLTDTQDLTITVTDIPEASRSGSYTVTTKKVTPVKEKPTTPPLICPNGNLIVNNCKPVNNNTEPNNQDNPKDTPIITKTLKLNMIDEQVRDLQKYLNNHNYTLATQGPGSPNKETNVFGPLTENAVKRFQEAMNITVDGIVGPITRSYIN